MTGCEIIIKKGNKFILQKMRHDGDDCLEFFRVETKDFFKGKFYKFETVATKYYEWRNKKWNLPNDEYQIESKYQHTGFPFTLKLKAKTVEEMYGNALTHAYTLLNIEAQKTKQCEGFICSYGDYALLVDYDRKTVTDLGEEEEEESEHPLVELNSIITTCTCGCAHCCVRR